MIIKIKYLEYLRIVFVYQYLREQLTTLIIQYE